MSYLNFSGGVVTYPYSLSQLRSDNPEVSFPAEIPDSLLAEYDAFPVVPVAKPAPSDPITKNVVEVTPVEAAGVWIQTWQEVAATAEQIAARQQGVTDAQYYLAVKGDAFVGSFIAMTPAQVTAYVEATITNITTAKAVINKLALMLLILARREFRNGE